MERSVPEYSFDFAFQVRAQDGGAAGERENEWTCFGGGDSSRGL